MKPSRRFSWIVTSIMFAALTMGSVARVGAIENIKPPTPKDAFVVLSRQDADILKKRIPKEHARLYCPFYAYKTFPHAVVENGFVYCVFQNSHGRPQAMAYDIQKAKWRGPVQISPAGLGKEDKHGAPSLCIDNEGYLHVFFGCHGIRGPMLYSKSIKPYNITAWEKERLSIKDATYPGLIRLANGEICLLYRQGDHLNPWALRISSDNCKTWSPPEQVIDMRKNHPDKGLNAYCRFFPGSDGKTIHCFWNLKDDSPTPSAKYAGLDEAVYRYNIYYIRRDADGKWRNAAGEKLALPVNAVQAKAKCLVFDSGDQFTLMQYGCRLGVDKENRPYVKFRTGVVDWLHVRDNDIEKSLVVKEPWRWKFASFESGHWRVTDRLPHDWPADAASLISARGTLAAGSQTDGRWFIFWPEKALTGDKGAYIFLYNEKTGYASRDGGPADEKENAATNKSRSILLSKTGGDRATAYVMSNKIARRNGRLLCTWIDSSRQNRWALVDPPDGKILHQGAVGNPRSDNHSGAAIATAPDGTLHLLTGEHHRPFVHYRMPPTGRPVWELVEDGKAIGIKSTYPSLVCDRRGTLHLAYRHRVLPHYQIDYCTRPPGGPWSRPRTLIRASVKDHTWLTNAIEAGPDGRLHVVLNHTRPLEGGARYYGASHIYSDDSGKTWRQFGDTEPLKLPVEVAHLKRLESDGINQKRVEPNVGSWDKLPGPLNSYYHQLLLSNLVIDEAGRPWVIVHNILTGDARLYHAQDDKWVGQSLLSAVEAILPEFNITHCGQLSRHNDGALDVVLMVAPKRSPGWGPKETELVRLQISTDGRIGPARQVCEPDPTAANWLPSIERWSWNAPIGSPALIFTRGINAGGYSANRNSVNTEVRLQLPEK
ncbi:MAG: BNR-4 repeat-containing protein [Pirellulales bacterium]|nr:BNR-4 repeat-containing protein [Pirellulales bacterium]